MANICKICSSLGVTHVKSDTLFIHPDRYFKGIEKEVIKCYNSVVDICVDKEHPKGTATFMKGSENAFLCSLNNYINMNKPSYPMVAWLFPSSSSFLINLYLGWFDVKLSELLLSGPHPYSLSIEILKAVQDILYREAEEGGFKL